MDKSVRECDDYYAYGETNSCGVITGTTLKFTGGERDTETGLDHTWFRQYSSSLGRWMRPDPAGLAAVDLSDPQSWNGYAYVQNNPLEFFDLFGLDPCPPNSYNTCASVSATGGLPGGIGGGTGGGLRLTPVQVLKPDFGAGNNGFGKLFKAVVCTATAPLVQMAQMNGGATGIGLGGGGGLGVILGGLAVQVGVQVVADSNGNVGLAFSGGYNPGFGVLGIGALAGIQYTRSTGGTIYDLRGGATSAGVSGALLGVGVGIDAAHSKSADSLTLTSGAGIGGRGAAFTKTGTAVPGFLSTDCGPK